MRPLSISMTAFGSFREPTTIDLRDISIAAICGANGSGKSTAFGDALTWSIYGKARVSDADSLISLGESEASVCLEFLLNGQTYRVTRQRRRGRDSQLNFQVRAENSWRTLNGKGVRETQLAIDATLRLSHEGFVSSAIFQQGDAGRFTQATPAERKAVLAEILGLEEWTGHSEAFRALALETKGRITAAEAVTVDLEERYAALDGLRETAAASERAHAQAVADLGDARKAHAAVVAEQAQVEQQLARRREITARIEKAERELREATTSLTTLEPRLLNCKAILDRSQAIRTAAEEYRTLSAERDALSRKQGELRALEGKRTLHERALQTARAAIESDLRLAEQRVATLKQDADRLEAVKAEGCTVRRAVEALDALVKDREASDLQIIALGNERAKRMAELAAAAHVRNSIAEMIEVLPEEDAPCPTCGTELTPEQRAEHLAELQTQLENATKIAAQREQALADAEAEVDAACLGRGRLTKVIDDGRSTRDRLAQLRTEYFTANEATQALPAAEEQVRDLEARLAIPDPAALLGCAETAQLIEKLGYDEQRHLSCQAQLAGLAHAERDLHTLEAAERDLPEMERQQAGLRATQRDREATLATEQQALGALGEVGDVLGLQAKVEQCHHYLEHQERTERFHSQELGAARNAVTTCEALGPQLAERRRERDALAQTQADYGALATACGRNGVQSLLIEESIGPLEQFANEILDRFSGNLRVRLTTLREKKSSEGVSETLDIVVSDEQGDRPISLWSGGEQFRISFALRLAMSRLLASRAGACIETLVVDEGLGCLDPEGQDRFVDCINAVKDLFGLILVISHIPEMHTRFGSQILVEKTDLGSTVQIVS